MGTLDILQLSYIPFPLGNGWDVPPSGWSVLGEVVVRTLGTCVPELYTPG